MYENTVLELYSDGKGRVNVLQAGPIHLPNIVKVDNGMSCLYERPQTPQEMSSLQIQEKRDFFSKSKKIKFICDWISWG